MPAQETIYKIFIASPSGLNEERKAFADVINEYNRSDAQYRGVSFRAVGWEDTLAGMGRPQEIINEELKECDFFLLLLHNRWGSNPGENKQNATSGTEEEFNLAMDCYNDKKSHMKQIVCAFKSVSAEQLADPGKQLQKVIKFKKKLEREKKLLYSPFFSIDEFKTIIRKQLGRWLLNHENDVKRDQKIEIDFSTIPNKFSKIEPQEIISSISDEDREKIIKNAKKLARTGKLVDAEIEFSKAIIYNSLDYELIEFASFLIDVGQLDKALMILNKILESKNNNESKAVTYSLLGEIMTTRGNFDEAEVLIRKALGIYKQLDHKEGMASIYGNLGGLLQIRGNLDVAEFMHENSLEIYEKLGLEKNIAIVYGNLSIIKQIRGNLDDAETMCKKALEINKKLDRKRGMASNYGNLGVIFKMRNDLDSAELMYTKALEIYKQLGNKVGIADNYTNLGIVFRLRNNIKAAKEMHTKSLEINEQLGRKQGIAIQYGNLGNIIRHSGDIDEAELMYKKALEINEQLGRKEGMAIQYGNLGIVLMTRGDLDGAELMYNKSLELDEQLGRKEGIALNYMDLGNLMFTRGDLEDAEKMYLKCLEIAEKQGFAEIIRKVSENLEFTKRRKKE